MSADLIQQHGLGQATDVVVSGCSAGGLAAYLHSDKWCDEVHAAGSKAKAKCVGLPDSGFFLDYQDPAVSCSPAWDSGKALPVAGASGASNATLPTTTTTPAPAFASASASAPAATDTATGTADGNFHCGLKWVFKIQNATAGVNQDCIAAYTAAGQSRTTGAGGSTAAGKAGGLAGDRDAAGDEDERWKCMFAEYTSEHVRFPLFAMQSQVHVAPRRALSHITSRTPHSAALLRIPELPSMPPPLPRCPGYALQPPPPHRHHARSTTTGSAGTCRAPAGPRRRWETT
jgi:hypothetical protein